METVTTVLEGEIEPRLIEVGQHLRNGAVVLALKQYHTGPDGGIIVLAMTYYGEFVTWVSTRDGSESFWGHYFSGDIEAALNDFKKRS